MLWIISPLPPVTFEYKKMKAIPIDRLTTSGGQEGLWNWTIGSNRHSFCSVSHHCGWVEEANQKKSSTTSSSSIQSSTDNVSLSISDDVTFALFSWHSEVVRGSVVCENVIAKVEILSSSGTWFNKHRHQQNPAKAFFAASSYPEMFVNLTSISWRDSRTTKSPRLYVCWFRLRCRRKSAHKPPPPPVVMKTFCVCVWQNMLTVLFKVKVESTLFRWWREEKKKTRLSRETVKQKSPTTFFVAM